MKTQKGGRKLLGSLFKKHKSKGIPAFPLYKAKGRHSNRRCKKPFPWLRWLICQKMSPQDITAQSIRLNVPEVTALWALRDSHLMHVHILLETLVFVNAHGAKCIGSEVISHVSNHFMPSVQVAHTTLKIHAPWGVCASIASRAVSRDPPPPRKLLPYFLHTSRRPYYHLAFARLISTLPGCSNGSSLPLEILTPPSRWLFALLIALSYCASWW